MAEMAIVPYVAPIDGMEMPDLDKLAENAAEGDDSKVWLRLVSVETTPLVLSRPAAMCKLPEIAQSRRISQLPPPRRPPRLRRSRRIWQSVFQTWSLPI